jgi:hypothetical protein
MRRFSQGPLGLASAHRQDTGAEQHPVDPIGILL